MQDSKDEAKEILQEAPLVSEEDCSEGGAAPVRKVRRSKTWIALAATLGLAMIGFIAAVLHRTVSPPQSSQKARPSTLDDNGLHVVQQRDGMCSTQLHLTEAIHRNLGGMGPDTGEEGIMLKGEYYHEGNMQHVIVHFHALTQFKLPLSAYRGFYWSGMEHFATGDGYLAKIRMHRSWRTEIKVEIVKPGPGHVLADIPLLAVTMFDIDGHGRGCEKIELAPAAEVVMAVGKKVDLDTSLAHEGIATFINTGTSADLPSSIESFDFVGQRQHAAEIVFKQTNTFTVTLQTGPPCGDRDFAYVFRANVECAKDGNGNPYDGGIDVVDDVFPDPPAPGPVTTPGPQSDKMYCVGCWIHGHFGFVPPCVDEPRWWAKQCF